MSLKHPQAATEFTQQSVVEIVRGGKTYFDLLIRMIEQAKESFHLQTYIYDDDETGRQVAGALTDAVKRGVKVYLMTDGYASRVMSHGFRENLKAAGIHFRMFEPLLSSKYLNFGRRLHHKIAVADAKYALVGGVNISNRYNDMPEKKAWLDFALYVEGEIARELCILSWKTWNGFPANMKITPCEEKEINFTLPPGDHPLVRMRREDWVRRKHQVSKSYIEMLRNADQQVIILCSYFLPGRTIRRLMKEASARGVKINVITAGRSDVILAKHAERWLYDWLLRNHIELYEYQLNVLHGKIAVCDSRWMTLGSYNVNDISAYASIELNLDVKSEVFVKKTEAMLEKIMMYDCLKISAELHIHTKNIFKQFIRWFSYQFIRAAFHLFTFYFKQRK
jgi:cardiolipin synthase A/B